MTEMQMR